jgi:antitoxin (DNA-binding transcriptional repressor) of toxin-antitoxin stability system
METVSVSQLKANFAADSKRAANVESFIITRYGKPLFRLVPPEKPPYRYINSGIVGGDPAEWTAPPFTDEELESFGVA